MQKLVWQNANGEELNLTSGNYGVTNWEGFSNTSLNIQSQQVPFQDGGVFLDALIEQRELSVTLAMQDNGNLEERYEMRRELIHILNPKLGEGYLIYSNDYTSKRIKCIPQIPLFENHNSNDSGTPKASLAWTACEPYWEDLDDTEVELEAGEEVTINNGGDIPAQIEIEINGYSVNPKIINQSTNKIISIEGEHTDPIDINTKIGQKSLELEKLEFRWNNGGIFNDVASNGNISVYVGNQICIEQNDGTITNIETVISEQLYAIIYADGKFVTCGENGIVGYSEDGYNWNFTKPDDEIESIFYDVVYDGNRFIFMTNFGVIIYTTDLSTYSNRISTGVSYALRLYYINGIYFVTGNVLLGDVIKYSTDLTTWSSTGIEGSSIVFAFGKYFVSGLRNIHTSYDLISWTSTAINQTLKDLTYHKNIFIASEGGSLYQSTDGLNWSETTSIAVINKLRFMNFQFVGVGRLGTICKSANGINWNNSMGEFSILPAGVFLSNIKTINDRKYYLFHPNNIDVSNPYTYVLIDNELQEVEYDYNYGYTRNLTYRDGIYISYQAARIETSQDGLSFTEYSSLPNVLYDIYFDDDICIAVGENYISTSTDGKNFTQRLSSSYTYKSITYGNGKYVAVGEGVSAVSEDGVNWTEYTSSVDIGGNLTFGNGYFFCAIDDSDIDSRKRIYCYVSADGINWTTITVINITDISWVGDEYTYIHTFFKDNVYYLVSPMLGMIFSTVNPYTWEVLQEYNKVFSMRDIDDEITVLGIDVLMLKSQYIATNIISSLTSDSDMNLNLQVGSNVLRLNYDDGTATATIKYRQKYIGV